MKKTNYIKGCLLLLAWCFVFQPSLFGQCGVFQLPSANQFYMKPIDLVQIKRFEPQMDGLLYTQIWTTGTTPQACCYSGSIQSRFDRPFSNTANGLPAHQNGPAGTQILNDSVGINSTNVTHFLWPNSGPEQAQQDGWLIIPPGIDTIFFQVGSNQIQASALYISNDSTVALNSSLQGMKKILEDLGGSAGNGDAVCWPVPDSLPSFGPGNAYRYARIRVYHYDLEDFANSIIRWDIGDSLTPIPRKWFHSVPTPNSIVPPPQSTVVHCYYAYRDQLGNFFRKSPTGSLGGGFVLDPRNVERDSTMFKDVNANFTIPRPFNCPVEYCWIQALEQHPEAGDSMLIRKWDRNLSFDDPNGIQQDYTLAFNIQDQDGFPTAPSFNNSPITISVSGLGSIDAGIPTSHSQQPDQFILDGWLAIPPKIECIPFRIGGNIHEEAVAFWAGMDYLSMKLVAANTGNGNTEASFCLPQNAGPGWKWLRVRIYTHDQTGDHDTYIEWDMGKGFVPIPSGYVKAASIPDQTCCPPATGFSIPTYYYGLQDRTGTVWQANGAPPVIPFWDFKDDLSLKITFDTLDPFANFPCSGLSTNTPGPSCDSTLAFDPCNLPPIAVNDSFYLVRNVGDTLNVLRKDSEPNPGDSIYIASTNSAPGGNATPTLDGQFVYYRPQTDFVGETNFEYTIFDYRPDSLGATATIVVFIEDDKDEDELANNIDKDDDNDGIPDLFEAAFADGDADGDDIPNELDLDSDNDGIPDIIEGGGRDPDHDGQVRQDSTGRLITDIDQDGLSDDEELIPPDSDGDGLPDFLDQDSDNDGILDIVEAGGSGAMGGITPADTSKWGWNNDPNLGITDSLDHDGDGIVERLDLDSDNDGIPNIIEQGLSDLNSDGRIDTAANNPLDSFGVFRRHVKESFIDSDHDSIPDYWDLDADNDGIPDVVEQGLLDTSSTGLIDSLPAHFGSDGLWDSLKTSLPLDSDQDGVPNFIDLDSDNDGIYDIAEEGRYRITEFEIDGRVGFPVDVQSGWYAGYRLNGSFDSDLDTVPDRLDLDSDNDGIPDVIEAGRYSGFINGRISTISGDEGTSDSTLSIPQDWDWDGTLDYLDIDSDNDGLLDAIEAGGHLPPGEWRFGGVDKNGWAINPSFHLDDTSTFDHDRDGHFNHLDLDSDNDGIPDVIESNRLDTCDASGQVIFAVFLDTQLDGIPPGVPRTDLHGKSDGWRDSLSFMLPYDKDKDGVPDFLDDDSDRDGIPDVREGTLRDLDPMGLGVVNYEPDSTGWNRELGITQPRNTDAMLYGKEDSRRDTLMDFRDDNSDGDALADSTEYQLMNREDALANCNPEGIPIYRDPRPCAPIFYEAITPNEDLKNDQFEIVGIEYYAQNQLSIYNRWGNLLFSSENYADEGYWHGQSNQTVVGGNQDLPEGVYFYTFMSTNSSEYPSILKKGFVYLLR